VRVWDWRAPSTPATVLPTHQDRVLRVAFASDGRHLASAGDDATVRVWDCQSCGDMKQVLELARSRVPREANGR
jgi:WD40 repeat protein